MLVIEDETVEVEIETEFWEIELFAVEIVLEKLDIAEIFELLAELELFAIIFSLLDSFAF